MPNNDIADRFTDAVKSALEASGAAAPAQSEATSIPANKGRPRHTRAWAIVLLFLACAAIASVGVAAALHTRNNLVLTVVRIAATRWRDAFGYQVNPPTAPGSYAAPESTAEPAPGPSEAPAAAAGSAATVTPGASEAAAAGTSPATTAEGVTAPAPAPTAEASATPASAPSIAASKQNTAIPLAPRPSRQARPLAAAPASEKREMGLEPARVSPPIGDTQRQSSAGMESPASLAFKTGAPPKALPGGSSAATGESAYQERIPATSTVASAAETTVGSDGSKTDSSVAPRRMVMVSSTDHSVYWALEDAGRIYRSTDRAGWQEQDSGVQADLLGGHVVSDTVCWVVGRNGTVLLTTDGTRWQQIKSPTTADLVSVSAASSYVAEITTANGSGFSTFDGGSNWQPGK